MGRRKDDPLLQAAKGFPGRRPSKVRKEIDAAAAEAEAAAIGDDPFPLPPVLSRAPAYWRRAIALWEQQADVLRASGRRRPGYRAALTRYCIWTQLYEVAADTLRKDLPKGGLTVEWQMGHGAKKIMAHPSIDIMKDAETVLRLLEGEFGFTPRGDSDLTRVETFNAAQGRLPFGGAAPGQQRSGGTPEPAADPMNLMTEADSPPPGTRPN